MTMDWIDYNIIESEYLVRRIYELEKILNSGCSFSSEELYEYDELKFVEACCENDDEFKWKRGITFIKDSYLERYLEHYAYNVSKVSNKSGLINSFYFKTLVTKHMKKYYRTIPFYNGYYYYRVYKNDGMLNETDPIEHRLRIMETMNENE